MTVFVPMAPDPGLGFLRIVSLEDSMSDALAWPLTWGAGTEAVLGQKAP